MNSSTSSSEDATEVARADDAWARSAWARSAWARFVAILAGGAGLGLLAFLGLALALDPYDTGRLALLRVPGIADQGPRTAHASRARDPAFQAALIGNSRLQLVMPEALTALTGLSFVSLTVPGTGPQEQLAILRRFLDRPAPVRALVIGTDEAWCTPDPALAPANPFPFWLYADGSLDYALGLLRWETLQGLGSRIAYVLGLAPRARPDGYWDYEARRERRADRATAPLAEIRPSTIPNATGAHPAVAALRGALAARPDVPVVLVVPPAHVNALPEPGSALEAAERACHGALRAFAAERPLTALVNRRDRRPEHREDANFFDHTHYRAPIARALEGEIAAALQGVLNRPEPPPRTR